MKKKVINYRYLREANNTSICEEVPPPLKLVQSEDFPQEASQAKKSTLGGVLDLQILPLGNKRGSLGSKIESRDLTEKVRHLEAVQITLSSTAL